MIRVGKVKWGFSKEKKVYKSVVKKRGNKEVWRPKIDLKIEKGRFWVT